MTQNINQSVRNAEAAKKIESIPTFEEVYAMKYVRESIESILDQNVRQYKMLAGFKDDLRQDILIHLNNELPKFNPAKASIQTFARIAIASGLRMARRRYYKIDNITLMNSLDIMDFENHDDDSTDLPEEDCHAYASHAGNNVELAVLKSDVQSVIAGCPSHLRIIAKKMLTGMSIRQLAKEYGENPMTFSRHHIRPLRRIFREKLGKN